MGQYSANIGSGEWDSFSGSRTMDDWMQMYANPVNDAGFPLRNSEWFAIDVSLKHFMYSTDDIVYINDRLISDKFIFYWDSGGLNVRLKCTPSWSCNEWSVCINGAQARTCTDGCNNIKEETQSCCTPNWTCDAWSQCNNNIQSRECNDGCGDTDTESQYCCTPEWKCNQPLNGKESDGCGNERFNQACIEIVNPPIVEPPITEQPSDNNMLIGTASLFGLIGLGYIAFEEISKKK